VLLGANKILNSKNRPREIFIEIHPTYLKKFGSTEKDVLEFLRKKNYKIKWNKKRSAEHLYHLTKQPT
jgi:predicted solute-binding protein